MWTRAELKARARDVLRTSYWDGVLVYLIYSAISIGVALISGFVPFGPVLATLFLMLPLSVGLNYFFMQNQIAPPQVQNIYYPFKSGEYMKIVASMGWMYLFIVLWSMISLIGFMILIVKGISSVFPFLSPESFYAGWPASGSGFTWPVIDSSWIPALVVSGVIYVAGTVLACIKGIAYSMTGYIMTDNPNIGYERALKLSIAMTDGFKWRIFVLHLSFIGWALLALLLTLGIGFLFLAPYIAATTAELYARLRDNAINSGLTSPQEMNVFPR